MDLLLYSFQFADIPVAALFLLAAAAIFSALQEKLKCASIAVAALCAAAVAIAFGAGADFLLTAALLFLVLSCYLYFLIRRSSAK